MYIRHHTNCSVESVVERSTVGPHIVFSSWKRSSVVETSTTDVSDQGLKTRGTPSSMTGSMKNSHCSIYNIQHIKNGVVQNRVSSSENRPSWRVLTPPLPPPDPPKKTIHNLPKNVSVSPSNFPSPVRPRDRSHSQSPSVNPVSWPLQRIHTQNPQSNVCWRNKEHTSQTLLPPHGNNVRDSPWKIWRSRN
jgi:hypothetical protein